MEVDGIPVRSLFSLNKDYLHFNIASYGVIPTEIIKLRQKIEEEIDAEPDLWVRFNYHRHFNEAADFIADLYKAPRDQLTLVPNVTHAISAVLNSLNLCADDEILINSSIYGSVRMQCEDVGAKLRCFEITFPFSHESIIKQYETELSQMSGKRKLAIIDHITCMESFLMPLQPLLQLCKKFDVLSLVDAAHAPGQLIPAEIDLNQLQPDFYTGNLHKWAFVPRTCAFLFVSAPFTEVIRQQIVSFFHKKSFRQRFAYTGTVQAPHVACIIPAFKFVDSLGGPEVIQSFVKSSLRQGVKYVTEKLETTQLCDEKYSAPFMLSVYLGPKFDEKRDLILALRDDPAQGPLFFYVREHTKLSAPAIGVINGRCMIRISAHVFTTMEDYHQLADGLLKLRNKLQTLTLEEVASLPRMNYSTKLEKCNK